MTATTNAIVERLTVYSAFLQLVFNVSLGF